MKSSLYPVITITFLVSILFSFKSPVPGDGIAKNFSLPSVNGTMTGQDNYPDAKGFIIVFTSNNCPFAKLYFKRLNALHDEYSKLNVPLLAIRSTDTVTMQEDCFDKMIKLSRKADFHFPYLADNDQRVAKSFHAEKTPHAFVIWKENDKWEIKYSGAIDDNGAEPGKVIHSYVKEALDNLLAGKEVEIPVTKSVGCAIKYRSVSDEVIK
jgi:peroxiredoxin